MKNKKDVRNIGLIIVVIVLLEVLLIILMDNFPTAAAFFVPLMAIILIVGIVRVKRNIADAQLWERMEGLKKSAAEKTGTGQTTSSYHTNTTAGASYGTGALGASSGAALASSQTPLFTALKSVSREYSNKASRQKYASYESMQEVCEKLNAYALSRGIKLAERAAEALVMAMVSGKCVFVKKTSENTEDILSVVGEFFSGEACPCLQLEVPPIRPLGLMCYYQDKELTATDFFKRVYASAFLENTVCICALKDFAELRFENIFSELIRLFKNPHSECFCTMLPITASGLPKIVDRKFALPHNAWFFFLLNGDEQLPEDVALWSEIIEVNGVGTKNEASATGNQPMAYSQFNELVEGAFDKNFLPLETWKKLDKLEDYLYGAVGFKIDNILARQLERVTTMQVACGATHAEAMDTAIAHKVLPRLSGYTKEQIDQEGTSLKELLDGLFGVENLPECHKALSALQLD